MEKWLIKNKRIDPFNLAKENNISVFLASLLINRSITEKEEINSFLNPDLEKLLDPYGLKDMGISVDLILKTIKRQEKIRIVGDYDVDGVMSIYILYRGLSRLGAKVDYTIPHRVDDGYGISMDIVSEAKRDGISLIITCDNGISAIEEVAYAKELGMNIIITDHHDLRQEEFEGKKRELRPRADGIINPKQETCPYKFKLLCGAGIAYKLIEGLFMRESIVHEINDYLIYAGIATICDVVDLVGENRIIVKKSLEVLSKTENIGLRELLKVSDLEDKEITVYHVGFIIGPSINASGRLESAEIALKMLLTEDKKEANDLALVLKGLNQERKEMTQRGVEEVKDLIENEGLDKDKIILAYSEEIHESIAGIVAGRIRDKYHRPVIVLTKAKDQVKGSARSIEEYDIFQGLSREKDLLLRYGGHPMAAGLSIDGKNIKELRNRLNEKSNLTEEDLVAKIYIDSHLPFKLIDYNLVAEVESIGPFGKGNPKPVFGEKDLRIKRARILGKDKNVIKLDLLKDGIIIEGIIFEPADDFTSRLEEKYGKEDLEKVFLGEENNIKIDIVFNLDINEYLGKSTLQVVIKSYRLWVICNR